MMKMSDTDTYHTASPVPQDKVRRVRTLGTGVSSKNQLQSPWASSEASGAAPRLATTRTGQQHQPSTADGVPSAPGHPAIIDGRRSQRMKWTAEMNTFIMRKYYEVTKLETDMTAYRQKLHDAWKAQYPNINATEQRIADQRRTIVVKNMIPAAVLENIKEEMRRALNQEVTEGLIDEAEEIMEQRHPTPQRPEKEMSYVQAIEDEFRKALIEFEGIDATKTHRIPRQRPNKALWQAVEHLNRYSIPTYLNEAGVTLDSVHTVVYCAAVAATRWNGRDTMQEDEKEGRKRQAPAWQRRLQQRIMELRRKIGQLTQYVQGNRKKKLVGKVKIILKKASIHSRHEQNGQIMEHLDTLKQSLLALSKRLRRYKETDQRKNDNRSFSDNAKAFYRNLNKEELDSDGPPTKEATEKFWGTIWANNVTHNNRAHWIEEERKETEDLQEMSDWVITEAEIAQTLQKAQNWKAPGIDNIHNYWYKKFTSTHRHLAEQLTAIIESPDQIPEFLTQGLTYMKPKDGDTRNPAKYRPITCLPTLYKILTSCIASKITTHIQPIMAEQQKGCQQNSKGCKEQLTIDAVIMEQAYKKKRNLYTAYIDYRKAYDSVPHSWLIEALKIYRVNPTIINFLQKAMDKWETTIKVDSIKTKPIPIRRGIFQGDSLSPIWFCLALNPLSRMLNSSKYGYTLKNNKENLYTLSHLMYMDDIKLYASSRNQLEQLTRIVEKFSKDIGMEFGLEKCRMQGWKQGKPDRSSHTLEKGAEIEAMKEGETYKYLGMLQAQRIEHQEIKRHLREKYHQRIEAILRTKLNGKNISTAINAYAAPVLTYSFGVINWTTTELEDVMRKTRTAMTKHRQLHPKSAIERMTISRNEGGRGIVDLIEQHERQVKNLRDYFLQSQALIHQAISNCDKKYTPLNLSTHTIETPAQERKQDVWGRKVLHGRHYHDLQSDHIDKIASNAWLTHGDLFPETEGFLIAIQDQVVKTRNYRKYIIKDPMIENDTCRRCLGAPETIQHITAGCKASTQTEYTERHNQVANVIHQKLARKYSLINPDESVPYYKYEPAKILENKTHKMYWDRSLRTDKTIQNNRPDIVLIDKEKKTTHLIDIAVPNTANLKATQAEKLRKYNELRYEIKDMWHMDKVTIVPVVISATGIVPKTLHDAIETLDIHPNTYIELQKAAILNTCRIVRKHIDN